MSSPSRLLHVANGSCTTRLIEKAGIGGALSIWADPLHEGPVPGNIADEALLEVRASFHSTPDNPAAADPINDLWRWRQVIDDHAAYDELVLWYEHDLFDQLNLVQLLTYIRAHVPSSTPVSLVCIGSFPGRPQFQGLGELPPEAFPGLFAVREPVGDAHYASAERAWEALRAPSPLPLDALHRAGAPALPFLAPALRRLLEEYPATIDGLSRTERRLMQLSAIAPVELGAVFPYMHEDERAYYISDSSLAELASTLASTSPRLLSFVRDGSSDRPLAAVVTLTDAGRAVLDRRLDRVACGLDRWIGGVHLQPGGPMWRWDDARACVTRA
jgi:hypothetical protein